MKLSYRKAIFIVTYRVKGDKIYYLILKRKLHWRGYEFPKGGVENKENFLQAAKREIFEETGQVPSRIKKFKIHGKYKYPKILDDRPSHIGQTYSLFAAQISRKNIKFDKREHSSYKWLEFPSASKLLTWPDQKKCLRIVDIFLKHST
jgi:8-oxo-dGTP pyrophosphatase MutT (NUDIX family)